MKRRWLVIAFVAAAAAAVCAAFVLLPDGEAERPILRPPPPVPHPADARSKAAFFYARMVSGDQSQHPGAPQANWRLFGEGPLVRLGKPALDFLLAPERLQEYRASPNILANVLRLLPQVEGFRNHPRFHAFLRHWLDPRNCPPKRPGADWPAELRRAVFTALSYAPEASFAPECEAELERGKSDHDLRNEAVYVLLHSGRGTVLLEHYPALPPNEEEPERYLRHFVLDELHRMAAPGSPSADRAQVEALRPLVAAARQSTAPGEAVKAAAVLLRLGEDAMVDWLLESFQRSIAAGDEAAAWEAMLLLVNDRPVARARDLCLEQFRGEHRSFVGNLLARGWGHEPTVRARLWAYLEEPGRFDRAPLGPLLNVDRERTVAYLLRAVRGDDPVARTEAIRFANAHRVTEIAPALLDLARTEEDEGRLSFYYATLGRLGAQAAVPLLRHALRRPGGGENWRKTVTTLLLQFGGDALDPIEEALRERDGTVLEALVPAAAAGGAVAVPDRLLPALLQALRTMPGEGGRLDALFVLRCRGVLDPIVREGLVEAYRREPSSRVAGAIADALAELAHR